MNNDDDNENENKRVKAFRKIGIRLSCKGLPKNWRQIRPRLANFVTPETCCRALARGAVHPSISLEAICGKILGRGRARNKLGTTPHDFMQYDV